MQLFRVILLAALVGRLLAPAWAEVKAASVFGDNMVLQQGQPVPVWGTAAPDEIVYVAFANQVVSTTATADGKWKVTLKRLKVDSTPRELTITGSNTIKFSNVLVGEVWVCSGQSNMEFVVAGSNNATAEATAADYPLIRMFTVGKRPAAFPQESCDGAWAVCSPQTVSGFSAVGYFFARELCNTLHVPIGMIHTSWGGTPAETWTSTSALKAMPTFKPRVEMWEQAVKAYQADKDKYELARIDAQQHYAERMAAWYKQLDVDDPGIKSRVMDPDASTRGWREVQLPVSYSNNPLMSQIGSLWARKEVEIPQAWVGKELEVHVGAVDEADDTYVNGTHVGRIWFDAPNYWQAPRIYPVPAAAVTSTKVSVTVRMLNLVGQIGMFGPETEMKLVLKGTNEPPVSLTGAWKYRVGLDINAGAVPQPNLPPLPGSNAGEPSTLFNGMIAPLIPYAIRGAIWYQGEANAGAPQEYRQLFPAMITSWRQAWGQGDFPFAFVQLANYMAQQTLPVEKGSWADIRESQTLTQKLKNTGMAVIIDIGDGGNIHPTNKQDVGKRLALTMLAKTYGKKLVSAGPTYRSMKVEGAAIRLHFDAADGLTAHGEQLLGFAIAGADKVYHAAKARIEGHTVVVSADTVPHPIAVRYAWANNPVCNLYNAANLPACPFRTDLWEAKDFSVAEEKISAP